ncbi:MAG: class E sortase, partial [Rubrobacteraceae bacterium]
DLPAWAVMGLTVPDLGIHDAPVRSSDGQAALDAGVVHVPGTSLPWDGGSQRNVYVAGHRLGWPGTGSFRIFYRLNELRRGDEVVLEDRLGRAYRYRVTERLVVNPGASWVTRDAPGRDMLSLQTCTPIPTFEKRLIVRAERVEDHVGKEKSPERRKN